MMKMWLGSWMILMSLFVVAAQELQEYVHVARLGAPAKPADRFGASLAVKDNFLYVGAPTFAGYGGVFVYQDTEAQGWVLSDNILTSSGTKGEFGKSIATDGELLVVGAKGSLFLFDGEGETWEVQSTIELDGIGSTVALSDDWIVAGHATYASNAGRICVVNRNSLVERITFLQPDALPARAKFGTTVAIDDDTIAVTRATTRASPLGAVYIYQLQGGGLLRSWVLQTETGLVPSGFDAGGGFLGKKFGYSLAILNGIVTAGSTNNNDEGAVWVWERQDDDEWVQVQMVEASNIGLNVNIDFGNSVAMSLSAEGQTRLVVGSPKSGALNGGALYTFVRRGDDPGEEGNLWIEEGRMQHCGAGRRDKLGSKVIIQGDVILASAIDDSYGEAGGVVHVFEPGRSGILGRLVCAAFSDGSDRVRPIWSILFPWFSN